MIVYTKDGEVPFPGATRYATDEHNNLEVLTGRDGEKPMACFAVGYWLKVVTDGE